jgi:hypothetical protein
LRGDERKAWRHLVEELRKMGNHAAAFCDAWGRWCRGKRTLNEYEGQSGKSAEIVKTGANAEDQS